MNKNEKKVMSCFVNLDEKYSSCIGVDWILENSDLKKDDIEKLLPKLDEQQFLRKMLGGDEYVLTESGFTYFQNQVAHDVGSQSRKIHYLVTGVTLLIAAIALLVDFS